jgi:alanine racemase
MGVESALDGNNNGTNAFPTRSWAEIDLDVLASNTREIRRITSPGAEVMAIVKADAYGHGAIQTAKIFLENGATRLGVSMLDEAIELRRNGIEAPILLLGHTDPRRVSEILSYDITQTVYTESLAQALSAQAVLDKKTAQVHIKIDTGMGRIGYQTGMESVEEILRISGLPGIEVEGVFTHLATADEADDTYARLQYARFLSILSTLEKRGLSVSVRHTCNSGGIMQFPEMHMDMVRAGLILYGMWPQGCPGAYTDIELHPAMTLKSSIIHVKSLSEGQSISYGRRFFTGRESIIATIPIGYADGYSRRLSNKAQVLLSGERASVVGNVCMDMCMIDVTHFEKQPQIGDEVVLFGTQIVKNKKICLPVDEISDILDTINYEITCLVGKRVPRVYLRDGQIVHMHSCIW